MVMLISPKQFKKKKELTFESHEYPTMSAAIWWKLRATWNHRTNCPICSYKNDPRHQSFKSASFSAAAQTEEGLWLQGLVLSMQKKKKKKKKPKGIFPSCLLSVVAVGYETTV